MDDNNLDDLLTAEAHRAPAQYDLALAQNITTNGRAFCALLAAISLAVYLKTGSETHVTLAIFAIVPIGISVLADICSITGIRNGLSITAYLMTIVVALCLLFIG